MSPKVHGIDANLLSVRWDAEMIKRFKAARQLLGLNQTRVAKLLGVSQSAIAKLETGRSDGGRMALTLGQLKTVFGKHTAYVVSGQGSEKYDTEVIGYDYHWSIRTGPKVTK